MMRVWAMRPEGWRVLGAITTTLVTGTTPFAATRPATGDCENPCRTMPYTPSSENAKQIAEIFMRLKMDEWHPDPADWAPYVLDDVYYVTETAQLSKDGSREAAREPERIRRAEHARRSRRLDADPRPSATPPS